MRRWSALGFVICIAIAAGCSQHQETATLQPPARDQLTGESITLIPPDPSDTKTPTPRVIPFVINTFIPSPTPACEGQPQTRLIVGERGIVSDEDPEDLNVREEPGTAHKILGILKTNSIFTVVEGPRCAGDYVWYRVTYRSLDGWIAEGDSNLYYVAPYFPG